VQVEVCHGLPCGGAEIHADVEAIGLVSCSDCHLRDLDGRGQLMALVPGRVVPGGQMPSRHEQGMTRADGETIPEPEDEVALVKHASSFGHAEGTIIGRHSDTVPRGECGAAALT
jgi:hypothetical protein